MGDYLDFNKLKIQKKSDNPLLNEVVNDAPLMKKLAELGVKENEIEHYLALLADYLDANKNCDKCKSLETCNALYPKMNRVLYLDDSGFLATKLGDCPRALKMKAIRNNYLYHDFDQKWLSVRFDAIKVERAKQVKRAFVTAYKSKLKRWVYIQGKSGSGKSYFAVAFTNSLASKGNQIAYLDVSLRFDELKSLAISNKNAFEKRLNLYANVDALVLDGFGGGPTSAYLRDQILLPLLLMRNRSKKFTIFLSSFSLNEVSGFYIKNMRENAIRRQIEELFSNNIDKEIRLDIGFDTML